MVTTPEPILEVRGLRVDYETRRGVARAVHDIDLTLYAGERFGLVGESGSGKSTLLLALLRMIKAPGRIAAGAAWLDGTDLLQLSPEEMRAVRLARVAMIPQGAMNSLNPVLRVADQIRLAMAEHGVHLDGEARSKHIDGLLDKVGLRPEVGQLFPHELSGGMKQRACIAQAICLSPRLLLADEPTSALDVVVQRRIMQTLRQLQEDLDATVLLVGHDMGLMAQFVDRLGIMYGGRLVEVGRAVDVLGAPRHPYTRLLIDSIPSFERRGDFRGIPGMAMSLLNPPTGCHFHPRCPEALARCREIVPALVGVGEAHRAACVLCEDEK